MTTTAGFSVLNRVLTGAPKAGDKKMNKSGGSPKGFPHFFFTNATSSGIENRILIK